MILTPAYGVYIHPFRMPCDKTIFRGVSELNWLFFIYRDATSW